jgi:hypothetical protein
MTELTMNAEPRFVRSSPIIQIFGGSRETVFPTRGYLTGAYCVARGETVKAVRPESFANSHVCSPPAEGCSKHFGRERTF